MKNGKMDYDFAKSEAKRLPVTVRDAISQSLDNCKDSSKTFYKIIAYYTDYFLFPQHPS